MVALSFVRTPDDVRLLRSELKGANIPIVAKIEKPLAWDNIDTILDEADGVMVARGDLGVEMALEKVPRIQKSIIRRARRKGRFVITATQMLESMMVQSHADARRSQRRGQRHLRRHRCGDAFGGNIRGQVSGGSGAVHGAHRRRDREIHRQARLSGAANRPQSGECGDPGGRGVPRRARSQSGGHRSLHGQRLQRPPGFALPPAGSDLRHHAERIGGPAVGD